MSTQALEYSKYRFFYKEFEEDKKGKQDWKYFQYKRLRSGWQILQTWQFKDDDCLTTKYLTNGYCLKTWSFADNCNLTLLSIVGQDKDLWLQMDGMALNGPDSYRLV